MPSASIWDKPCNVFSFALDTFDPVGIFEKFAHEAYSLFFDSNDEPHPDNLYSYICLRPYETIEYRNGAIHIKNSENEYTYQGDPFLIVKERLQLRAGQRKTATGLPPFQGGAAGFFGYDLVRYMEDIHERHGKTPQMPDLCIGLYDMVFAFDHRTKKSWFIVHSAAREQAEAAYQAIMEEIKAVSSYKEYTLPPPSWVSTKDGQSYEDDIARIIEYIHAGDIFQANLSRRFVAAMDSNFSPFSHYRKLRAINPAPFSGYLNFGPLILSGSSPEQFLSVHGNIVKTKPIKGTLPSDRPAQELTESRKDRAENVMIVDLLRNDLSKVCEDHSVTVDKLCDVESFSGLHHLVSTISARLRADKHAVDILRACFPGGSITGAPKIRAMQIIEELETSRRGPYCGASGFIGYDGMMETNIMIRTIIYHGGKAFIQAGGGITALSDSALERREADTKLKKIFESFGNVQNDTPH